MEKLENQSYFRSMSTYEYRIWQKQDNINKGMEWAVKTLYMGFALAELKNWVDDDKKIHDLVICVDSIRPAEFTLATREDRFSIIGNGGNEYKLPYGYINQGPIDFKRAKIVYDPRAVVSSKPVLELEQIILRPKRISIFKKFFHKSR